MEELTSLVNLCDWLFKVQEYGSTIMTSVLTLGSGILMWLLLPYFKRKLYGETVSDQNLNTGEEDDEAVTLRDQAVTLRDQAVAGAVVSGNNANVKKIKFAAHGGTFNENA